MLFLDKYNDDDDNDDS